MFKLVCDASKDTVILPLSISVRSRPIDSATSPERRNTAALPSYPVRSSGNPSRVISYVSEKESPAISSRSKRPGSV